ncbi:MAG: hypothetical protein GX847_05045, partial [Clostridiales bacterium]|nr:hypothetical protein [Clostridiales bacterium]
MKSSKKIINVLTVLLICVFLITGTMTSAAAADFEGSRLGSLRIEPTYNSKVVPYGTFNVYYVASLDASSGYIVYTLEGEFAQATTLDINKVKTAQQVLDAATLLKGYTRDVDAHDYCALDLDKDGSVISGLKLGVYLVVQTGAPSSYGISSPFLVFLPIYVSGTDAGWDY